MITPNEHYPALAKAIGVSDIYFKREDLHPYGSHKGRSIPVMMDYYYGKGDRRFVISSSGNAALAAALYAKDINSGKIGDGMTETVELTIFVGQKVNKQKMEKLKSLADDKIRVLSKERPLQALNQAINEGMRSLRQSTDDIALIGYKDLALELAEIKDLSAIFIGTSSGTTAQALAQYFSTMKNPVQIHIIQTSSCHPISDEFETYDGPDEISIADAIVGKTTERKTALVSLINKTEGYGWTASNDDIKTAIDLVAKHAVLDISTNSALSIVGVMQATYRAWKIGGSIVCLICGD